MRKQTDVDILAELSKLVDAHVRHYKEDFVLDQRLITQAAKAEDVYKRQIQRKPLCRLSSEAGRNLSSCRLPGRRRCT